MINISNTAQWGRKSVDGSPRGVSVLCTDSVGWMVSNQCFCFLAALFTRVTRLVAETGAHAVSVWGSANTAQECGGGGGGSSVGGPPKQLCGVGVTSAAWEPTTTMMLCTHGLWRKPSWLWSSVVGVLFFFFSSKPGLVRAPAGND